VWPWPINKLSTTDQKHEPYVQVVNAKELQQVHQVKTKTNLGNFEHYVKEFRSRVKRKQ